MPENKSRKSPNVSWTQIFKPLFGYIGYIYFTDGCEIMSKRGLMCFNGCLVGNCEGNYNLLRHFHGMSNHLWRNLI